MHWANIQPAQKKTFIPHRPPPARTHISAGSRFRPANAGIRNHLRGLTRPAQDSNMFQECSHSQRF